MPPSQTALLLIDFQADFGSPDGAMASRGMDMRAPQAALKQAVALTEAARAAGVKVVFVRLLTRPGDESGQGLCVEGTRGAAFIGPQPQAGEAIITKSRFSGFASTSLAEDLGRWGVRTVILAGLTTECCVAATAWAAFEKGLSVQIAADACAAYEEELHRVSLKALAGSGATVDQTAQFVAAWK